MIDPLLLRLGVLTAAQLDALGVSRPDRDAALADGRLRRVRRGWYARADADARVAAAVGSHGCVACADALRLRGTWVPESLGRGHVRRPAHLRRLSVRGCSPFGVAPPVHAAVDDVETAFRCLLRCGDAEDAIVVADSLLHLRLANREELERWCLGAPARMRTITRRVDVAESGLESIARVRLRSRRVHVRAQVWIDGRRVDLLIGDRLVIECDGAEHHASWDAQSADRARDRALTAAGYLVIRLTYRQILDDRPGVEQDVLALVRRGAHRWPRRRIHG